MIFQKWRVRGGDQRPFEKFIHFGGTTRRLEVNQTLDQISNFKGQKGQETQVKQNIQEWLERKEGQQAMLMLNLYFESKKSEEIKVERFIGWSAIEPKPPRQQLTKTMSYTIKVIAEKYISQESESRKKRIMCSPLLLHPLQGSSCSGVDLLPQPPSMPRSPASLGDW